MCRFYFNIVFVLYYYSGNILEIICKYFMYKAHYQKSLELVPEFPINPDDALQLMKASTFLDC